MTLTETAPPSAPAAPTFTIAEAAERMGVNPHTLRYYERVGLLSVGRDGGGRRVYDENDLSRIRFISCLRSTNLPIRQLQRYFDMVDEGPETEGDRLGLLEEHRENVLAQLADIQQALAAIEFKIEIYGGSHVTD